MEMQEDNDPEDYEVGTCSSMWLAPLWQYFWIVLRFAYV
jgi:hypothetical protein